MEVDLGTQLQWVATAHYNTEHPHVHVALRGMTDRNQPLRLPKDYIRHGIRGSCRESNNTSNWISYRLGCRGIRTPRDPTDSLYLAGSHPQVRNTVPVGADRTEHFVVDLKKRAPMRGSTISNRDYYSWKNWN